MGALVLALALLGCSTPPPPPATPDPCVVMATPAPGPLAAEIAAAVADPARVAALRVAEAERTGDPGFYTLAEQAAACARARSPDDPAARRVEVVVRRAFHELEEAEAGARSLAEATDAPGDWLALGDVRVERGAWDAAAEAYARAEATAPGPAVDRRVGWLAWERGDRDAAEARLARAAGEGTPAAADADRLDALARLGWLRALGGSGPDTPELDRALAARSDDRWARWARGRVRLLHGHPGAAEDLRAALPLVPAAIALAELDPSTAVDAAGARDGRAWAGWLADRGGPDDLRRARTLLDEELARRSDPWTLATSAWARHQAGEDAAAEARRALATGSRDPEVLLRAGLVLGDADALGAALGSGPGLLPSQRARAEAARVGR